MTAPAAACTCEPPLPERPTVAEVLSYAHRGGLSYVGIVVADTLELSMNYRHYTVEVEATLGGEHRDVQVVASSVACGPRLDIGVRYLLRPVADDHALRTFGAPFVDGCFARAQVIADGGFIGQVLAPTVVAPSGWAQVKRDVPR